MTARSRPRRIGAWFALLSMTGSVLLGAVYGVMSPRPAQSGAPAGLIRALDDICAGGQVQAGRRGGERDRDAPPGPASTDASYCPLCFILAGMSFAAIAPAFEFVPAFATHAVEWPRAVDVSAASGGAFWTWSRAPPASRNSS